ncbi:uncharacterized protein LOC131429656 isoform X2 [Malaya genurostris]|uniref:uncharacterized protein LOC131429656 isoform X2 n=1 Tax=Malaya genurostris TaxID=325434 RepID=UPI0026F3EE54|nr:uncharacterized protein LOC131429656 isoform X2 [Malaya genurostris]
MYYIRERLSLNLPERNTSGVSSTHGTDANKKSIAFQNTPSSEGNKLDETELSEVSVSPATSAFPGSGTPQSTYTTPFQSPVASDKWYPHSQAVLPQQTTNTVVRIDKSTPSPSGVFTIDHGQFSGYPHGFPTHASGGYLNHSFTNDNGNNVQNSGVPNQPQWNFIAWCFELQNRRVNTISTRIYSTMTNL